jgi:hypothetical protein
VQDGFIWGNQIIPILENQFLPVFWTAAVPSDILMEEMRVGNDPGIESDFECVVGDHPIIIFGDFRFLYQELVREQPARLFP